ncbi:MAG: hypothetical protein A2283_22295 [Lentisphaerae bacterium RIFOXYA12_FULL_48_11]|nr:MAG: hypothetical protein A2283_22295 [Lentisphaerae bacterium RIFOXYA12_FULL_48_11]
MKTEATASDFFRFKIQFWGLITATGVIAAVASAFGFLGRFNWFLDLFSHFRVQYFLGLTIISLLFLTMKKVKSVLFFGILAAINLGVILPQYFGKPSLHPSVGQQIRIMLANVNTRNGQPQLVVGAIRRFNPDILVLEEVSTRWLSNLKPALAGYQYTVQEPREDNFGIALWSRFPLTSSRIVEIGNAEVPSIVAEIDTAHGKCTVLATHPLPPAGSDYSNWRNSQLAELPKWVKQASSPAILIGDLNTTPWNYYFKRLLRESGLKNSTQGRGVCPTWPAFNPLMLIPLDHCLYSDGIRILNRQTGPYVGSDHFPVIIDFTACNPSDSSP